MPTVHRSLSSVVWLTLALSAALLLGSCGQPTATPVANLPTAAAPTDTAAPTRTPEPTLAPTAAVEPTLPPPTSTAPVASPTTEATAQPTEQAEEGDPVEAWEGVIVKLAPGSQFGQYFQRSDGERYDIGGVDDAVREQLLAARWRGASIRVWGRVYYGAPATEARHIEVQRLEWVTEAASEARNLSPFAQADANSHLPSDGYGSYGPLAAIDGVLETAWVEGAADAGVGQSLTLTFPEEIVVDRVAISGGYEASDTLWAANNRIKRATLILGGQELPLELRDARGMQSVEVGGIATTSVTLRIVEVYPGAGANDTCVAEFEVWGRTQ